MDTPKAVYPERLLQADSGCYQHGQLLTASAELLPISAFL